MIQVHATFGRRGGVTAANRHLASASYSTVAQSCVFLAAQVHFILDFSRAS